MRRSGPGRWLGAIGFMLLLIAAALVGTGIARFDAGEFTDLVEDPASVLDTRLPSPGSETVRLGSGKYWVFAMGDRLTRPGDGGGSEALAFMPPRLTIRGPEGPIAVATPGPDVSVGGTSKDLVLIYEFRAPSDGRYTLRTAGGSTRVTEIGVGDTGALWDTAKHILGPVALMVLGGLIGLLGGILLLVAAILWITARSRGDAPPPPPVDATSAFG